MSQLKAAARGLPKLGECNDAAARPKHAFRPDRVRRVSSYAAANQSSQRRGQTGLRKPCLKTPVNSRAALMATRHFRWHRRGHRTLGPPAMHAWKTRRHLHAATLLQLLPRVQLVAGICVECSPVASTGRTAVRALHASMPRWPLDVSALAAIGKRSIRYRSLSNGDCFLCTGLPGRVRQEKCSEDCNRDTGGMNESHWCRLHNRFLPLSSIHIPVSSCGIQSVEQRDKQVGQ